MAVVVVLAESAAYVAEWVEEGNLVVIWVGGLAGTVVAAEGVEVMEATARAGKVDMGCLRPSNLRRRPQAQARAEVQGEAAKHIRRLRL